MDLFFYLHLICTLALVGAVHWCPYAYVCTGYTTASGVWSSRGLVGVWSCTCPCHTLFFILIRSSSPSNSAVFCPLTVNVRLRSCPYLACDLPSLALLLPSPCPFRSCPSLALSFFVSFLLFFSWLGIQIRGSRDSGSIVLHGLSWQSLPVYSLVLR